MLVNIIFSFNRAMQLDYLLRSTLKHLKFSYKIVIIYHTSGKHKDGYDKIIDQYSYNSNISFIERKIGNSIFFDKIFRNNKSCIDGNFKKIVESVLKESECEFTMFNTDDGYWYEDFVFEPEIINLIRFNPKNVSYKLTLGDNLDEFPNYVKRWGEFYLWDYYYDSKLTHWSYPFSVDATVYDTKSILEVIKNVEYYNPVTLEDFVVNHIKSKNLFTIGLSPIKAKLIGTKLNRVAVETKNPTIHINPDILNSYFIDDYKLELTLPENITNSNIVPLEVNVVKNEEKINLYVLDEFGVRVQENLGAEGAKQQMD